MIARRSRLWLSINLNTSRRPLWTLAWTWMDVDGRKYHIDRGTLISWWYNWPLNLWICRKSFTDRLFILSQESLIVLLRLRMAIAWAEQDCMTCMRKLRWLLFLKRLTCSKTAAAASSNTRSAIDIAIHKKCTSVIVDVIQSLKTFARTLSLLSWHHCMLPHSVFACNTRYNLHMK